MKDILNGFVENGWDRMCVGLYSSCALNVPLSPISTVLDYLVYLLYIFASAWHLKGNSYA